MSGDAGGRASPARGKSQTDLIAAAMSEKELQDNILELAHALGWLCVHFRPAQTVRGWRTPFTGDAGFVDTVLARRGRVIHVEVKREKGPLGPGQEEWGAALGDSYRLWRPSDWFAGVVEEDLR